MVKHAVMGTGIFKSGTEITVDVPRNVGGDLLRQVARVNQQLGNLLGGDGVELVLLEATLELRLQFAGRFVGSADDGGVVKPLAFRCANRMRTPSISLGGGVLW